MWIAVSGATYSSVGIIQAVRDALGQAAVNGTSDTSQNNNNNNSNNNGSSDNNNSTVTGTVPYKEGIYYGTAEGYSGDVSVAVVIQEKTIKAILITESSDDERSLPQQWCCEKGDKDTEDRRCQRRSRSNLTVPKDC